MVTVFVEQYSEGDHGFYLECLMETFYNPCGIFGRLTPQND